MGGLGSGRSGQGLAGAPPVKQQRPSSARKRTPRHLESPKVTRRMSTETLKAPAVQPEADLNIDTGKAVNGRGVSAHRVSLSPTPSNPDTPSKRLSFAKEPKKPHRPSSALAARLDEALLEESDSPPGVARSNSNDSPGFGRMKRGSTVASLISQASSSAISRSGSTRNINKFTEHSIIEKEKREQRRKERIERLKAKTDKAKAARDAYVNSPTKSGRYTKPEVTKDVYIPPYDFLWEESDKKDWEFDRVNDKSHTLVLAERREQQDARVEHDDRKLVDRIFLGPRLAVKEEGKPLEVKLSRQAGRDMTSELTDEFEKISRCLDEDMPVIINGKHFAGAEPSHFKLSAAAKQGLAKVQLMPFINLGAERKDIPVPRPPGEPTLINRSTNYIAVRFSPPSLNEKYPILAYEIYWSEFGLTQGWGDAEKRLIEPHESKFVKIGGLRDNTRYFFAVKAKNRGGWSRMSVCSDGFYTTNIHRGLEKEVRSRQPKLAQGLVTRNVWLDRKIGIVSDMSKVSTKSAYLSLPDESWPDEEWAKPLQENVREFEDTLARYKRNKTKNFEPVLNIVKKDQKQWKCLGMEERCGLWLDERDLDYYIKMDMDIIN